MAGTVLVGADTQVVFFPPSGAYPEIRPGSVVWIGQVQETTFDEVENREIIRYIGGGDRNFDTTIDRGPEYTGRIRFYPQDGKIWSYAIGSVATAGSTHTMSETGGKLYWYGLELYQGDPNAATGIQRRLAGVYTERMTIRGREGEAIECEIEYNAGSVAISTTAARASVTAATTAPYMWDDALIHISGGTSLDDDLTEVKEFEWGVNNNFDHPFYMTAVRQKGESIPAAREYEVSITLNMTKGTGGELYTELYKGGSVFNMNIFLFRTSGSDQVDIAMSGCKCTEMEMPLPIEGVIEQTMTVIPQACTIVVKDTNTWYPAWNEAK